MTPRFQFGDIVTVDYSGRSERAVVVRVDPPLFPGTELETGWRYTVHLEGGGIPMRSFEESDLQHETAVTQPPGGAGI